MVNYRNSKIYKLTSGGLTFIGATTDRLSRRKSAYISHYKRGTTFVPRIIFETGAEVNITLIERFRCSCIEELNAKRNEYIQQLDCINKVTVEQLKEQIEKERVSRLIHKMRFKHCLNMLKSQ